jgi:hypothetical protein
MYRLHGGAAELVDRYAGERLGQSGKQSDQAPHIQTLFALRKGTADDEILDLLRLNTVSLDQSGYHLSCDDIRAHVR